jgi:hypothetical protein
MGFRIAICPVNEGLVFTNEVIEEDQPKARKNNISQVLWLIVERPLTPDAKASARSGE